MKAWRYDRRRLLLGATRVNSPPSGTQPAQVSERSDAREKEVSPTSNFDKLRQAGDTAVNPVGLRDGKPVRRRATCNSSAIAEQWIAFCRKAGELGAHDPGVLNEFELPADVRD